MSDDEDQYEVDQGEVKMRSLITKALKASFTKAKAAHGGLAGVGLTLRSSILELEGEDEFWEEVRTLWLKSKLQVGRSRGVAFRLFAHARAREDNVDFGCSIKWGVLPWEGKGSPPLLQWRLLCSADNEDRPTERNPNRQVAVMHTSGLSLATLAAIRAALFRGAPPAASAAVSSAALVALVLAAAGAELDQTGYVCLGPTWEPESDSRAVAAAAAAGHAVGSPGFPGRCNWIQRAARVAGGVAEPYDVYFNGRM
jgi:hypothetical protein